MKRALICGGYWEKNSLSNKNFIKTSRIYSSKKNYK